MCKVSRIFRDRYTSTSGYISLEHNAGSPCEMCDAKYCDDVMSCDDFYEESFCREHDMTHTIYGGGDPSMEWDWWIYEGGTYVKARCACYGEKGYYGICYGALKGGL